MKEDPLVSISAAAREIGVSQSTLSRQIRAGSIRSHAGKVRVSEVLLDRKNNVDTSRWDNRKKRPHAQGATRDTHTRNDAHARFDAHAQGHELEEGDDVNRVLIDDTWMTIADAKTMAENYRMRLAKLQLEIAERALREGAGRSGA
jgi:transposase-like protein